MARTAAQITLSDNEREVLLSWVRSGKGEHRMSQRAEIILAAAKGKTTRQIASELRTRTARVSKWRTRFARHGMEGLRDDPRSGKPRRYDATTERRILAVLDEKPPMGYSTWTGKQVAKRLGGDVTAHQVWRVLRRHTIHLQRRRSWCVSTDPEFAPKAADIVGLYLDPPENAVVVCVDEKPHIQALERAQGWLKLPNGRAVTGFNHEYKRHGTTTLFAALEVATGLVKTGHFNRRRRRDFLTFMNSVVADYPDQEIHVILDNLSTHKPKKDSWLSRHKNVHLHYTPTHASWLNQVEIWFSILSRRALRGASFTSPRQVREAIDRYVEVHNQEAAPFEWRKRIVYQNPINNKYSNLRN
jgi:transposase